MIQEVLIKFFNLYFQFGSFSFIIYIILCNSFPLKVSKKKAYVMGFIYSNYVTFTDGLSMVLVGGGTIPFTQTVNIILKINIAIEVLLYLPFIIRYVNGIWYRCYWWALSLVFVMPIPGMVYAYYFTVSDANGTIVKAVQLHTLPIYSFCILLYIIWGSIFFLLGKNLYKIKKLSGVSKWNLYIFYACYALMILFSNKSYNTDDEVVNFASNYRSMIIFIVGTSILLLFTVNQTEKRSLRIQNQLLIQHNKLQYSNYLALKEQEQEICKLYDEIGGHIKAIHLLINKGDRQRAEVYTRELMQQYRRTGRSYFCGNKIINAVLVSKDKVCGLHGIGFQAELRLPGQLNIKEIDLMCVFTNLLDNAIEGCVRNTGKDNYIKLKAFVIGNYLSIKVTNSKARENLPLKKEEYKTWKSDKKLHGYGMKIIQEIVMCYEGQKEFKDRGEEFTAFIMLRNTGVLQSV